MSSLPRAAILAIAAALVALPSVAADSPYFRFRSLESDGTPKPGQANSLSGTVPGLSIRQGRSVAHGPGTASGGTAPYAWTLHAGPMPAGMSVGADGVISGVASSAGTWSGIVLALSDAEGRKGLSNAFSVNVLPSPGLTYRTVRVQPGRTVSIPPQPSNLVGSPTYALTSGSLPTGLRLDADGVIRGALPTVAGTGPLAVTLRDSDGEPATSPTFSVEAATTNPLLTGQDLDLSMGQDFLRSLATSGFPAPPRYVLASGSLPAGVFLDAEHGSLYGRPSVAGTFPGIVVTASAQDGTTASTDPFSIRVSAAGVDNPGALRARLFQSFDRQIASRGLAGGATWHSIGTAPPPGMAISADGRVYGVPTRVGVYQGLDATVSTGSTALSTGPFSVEVYSDSLFVGMGDIRTRAGSTVRRTATLDPTGTTAAYSLSAPLPSGLRLDAATGTISGTPTVPGNASGLRLSATAGSLSGTSSPFSVTVAPALEAFAGPVGGIVGTRVEQSLTVEGLIGTATWRLVAGTLPDGLSLGPNGIVSGTPTRAMTVSGLIARVTDSGDGSAIDTAPFTAQISASDRMLVTGLSGVYGTRVNRPLTLPRPVVQNAVGTPRFSVAGTLPTGLSVDAVTGTVSSSPGLVTQTGSGEPLTVVATDARPSTASSPTFAVRLVGPLQIAGVMSVTGRVGDLIDLKVSGTNVIGEPAYSLVFPSAGDALPQGLFFSESTGHIFGRPMADGTLTGLRIVLRDGADGEVATSEPFDVAIAPGIVIDGPEALSARVGQPFDSADQFKARYAQDGLTWSYYGSLPSGLQFDAATGRIFGTPTKEGTVVGLKLVARQGRTGISGESRPFSVVVKGPLYVVAGRSQGIRLGQPASVSPEAFNKVGDVTWSLAKGAPPTGMSFDAQTGRIYGVPTLQGSTGPIVFKARDSIGQEALSQDVTIQVGDQLKVANLSTRFETRLLRDIGSFNPFTVTGAAGEWSVKWSELPKGLVAAKDGTLTGSVTESEPWSKYVTATVTDSTGATATSNNVFIIAYWDKPYLTGYTVWSERQTRKSTAQAFVGKPMMFSSDNLAFPYYTGIIDNPTKHYEIAPGGRIPSWATLNRKTGDLSGTPPTVGEYHADVVLVDDKDGARSDPHDYTIVVRDGPVIPPSGNYVIRTRTGTTVIDPVFSKVFPGASFNKRPNGWCRSNFSATGMSGRIEAGSSACDIRLYNFNNTVVGTWDDLWIEALDDSNVARRINLSVHVAQKLTIRAPAGGACSRGNPVSVGAGSVGGIVGTPTYMTRSSNNASGPDEGFTFDATTGVLTGKPLQLGTRYGYAIGVRDDWDGSTAWTENFYGELRKPLSMTYSGPINRSVGDAITNLSANTGGTAPYGETRVFSLVSAPATAPTGITFAQTGDNDGFFSGTFAAPGAFEPRVRLTAACPEGLFVEETVRFNVAQRVWPNTVADMTATEGVQFTSDAPSVRYATPPMRWELRCCGALPKGLTVEAATGRIVGKPDLGSAGVYNVELSIYDAKGNAPTGKFKVTVKPSPAVNYPDRSIGRVGKPLVAAPSPLGATGPLRFALAAGSALSPDTGMTLNPDTGEVLGTPTKAGLIEGLRVVMTESAGGASTSNAFAIEVGPGISASVPAQSTAKVGEAFTLSATATGTVGAPLWDVAAGALPDGIALDPASGVMKGTPVLRGTFGGIRLRVSDAAGGSATTEPFTVTVAEGVVTEPDPDSALGIFCNPAVNESVAGGGGSPTPPPFTGTSCQLGLWAENQNAAGRWEQYSGSVNLVDKEGAPYAANAYYRYLKIVDIETNREFDVGKSDFSSVFKEYVTGSGTFSRRFYAIGQVLGKETRTSAPFTLYGSYGKEIPPAETATWTWGEMVCRSSRPSGHKCVGRQQQTCSGTACPAPTRSCFVLYEFFTGSAYLPGEKAGDTCNEAIYAPDDRNCFLSEPADLVRLEPMWTVKVNGVETTVYDHPAGFSSPVRPTKGLLASLSAPYEEVPVTKSMWQFNVTGGASGSTTLTQSTSALLVDRYWLEAVYLEMNRYDPKDIVVGVDGPVLIVPSADTSAIAKAVDESTPGTSTIRGAGPFSIWHCVGSVCTVRLKAK